MDRRKAHRVRLVFVTASSEEQAANIARALVSERLAACANLIGPVRSIYRWRGAVEDEREFLMIVKTRDTQLARLERRVRELHSYEVPEIIAVTPDSGSAPYLDWLMESTNPPRAVRKTKRRI